MLQVASGSAAVQIAKHFGAHVTGVCSTANGELVRSIGADAVIDYTQEDFATTGESYDIILDATGTAPLRRCENALKPNGRLLVVLGSLGTALGMDRAARGSGKKVIAGVAAPTVEDLRFLAALAEAGEYKPVIDRSYPLENTAEAHAYVDVLATSAGASSSTWRRSREGMGRPRKRISGMRRPAFLCAIAVACGAPTRESRPLMPPPPAARATTPAAEPLPPSIRAAIERHGGVQGDAIHILANASVKEPERWIAFVGTSATTHAAWAVDAHGEPYPVTGWPVGVRVLAFEVDVLQAFVLVESVGVLDQPRGMQGVFRLSGFFSTPKRVRADGTPTDSVGVTNQATLHQAVVRATTRPSAPEPLVHALVDASASVTALASALSPAGADLFEVWQDALLRPMGHVERGSLATFPGRDTLLSGIHAVAANAWCVATVCALSNMGIPGLSGVLFVPGTTAIAGYFSEASPGPTNPHVGTPSAIAHRAPSPESIAAFRELQEGALRIETNLGAKGTLAVADSTSPDEGLLALLREGDFATIVPIHAERGAEVAFLDADGDGVLDVLSGTGASGWSVDAIPPLSVFTYPTTWTALPVDDKAMEYVFVTMRAKTLADAEKAILENPRESVTKAEACALLKKARTVAGFRSVAAEDAVVLRFTQPHAFLGEPRTVTTGAHVKAADLAGIDDDCDSPDESDHAILCRGAVCGVFNYALGNFHWFGHVGGKLRLRATAIYVGS